MNSQSGASCQKTKAIVPRHATVSVCVCMRVYVRSSVHAWVCARGRVATILKLNRCIFSTFLISTMLTSNKHHRTYIKCFEERVTD